MQNERYNPGELDTRITVLSVTQTRGDQGQKTKAPSVYGDVFAKVTPSTDDFVSDDNYEALTTVSVLIYKIPALQTQWRLRIDGVEYEITGIDPISRWSPFCVLTARTISK
jgi:head-tail adaptor